MHCTPYHQNLTRGHKQQPNENDVHAGARHGGMLWRRVPLRGGVSKAVTRIIVFSPDTPLPQAA